MKRRRGRPPVRRSGPFAAPSQSGDDLEARHLTVVLVNQHPGLWRRLFELTADDRVDWQFVLRKLEGETMKSQVEFALAHPVFDPAGQIVRGHYWRCGDDMSACLTVNIGME